MGDDKAISVSVLKVIPEKVAEKVYDDALSKSSQQVGKLSEDCLKTARLILAPIQLLGALNDRFEGWVETIRHRVPEERQTQAPPEIAGPVLENLKYITDQNPLQLLYLNLLTRAIDRDRQDEAHPAFVRIIEQLSADEAIVLHCFFNNGGDMLLWQDEKTKQFRLATRHEQKLSLLTEKDLTFPGRLNVHLSHLASLNLLATRATGVARFMELTEFGKLFALACIPQQSKKQP